MKNTSKLKSLQTTNQLPQKRQEELKRKIESFDNYNSVQFLREEFSLFMQKSQMTMNNLYRTLGITRVTQSNFIPLLVDSKEVPGLDSGTLDKTTLLYLFIEAMPFLDSPEHVVKVQQFKDAVYNSLDAIITDGPVHKFKFVEQLQLVLMILQFNEQCNGNDYKSLSLKSYRSQEFYIDCKFRGMKPEHNLNQKDFLNNIVEFYMGVQNTILVDKLKLKIQRVLQLIQDQKIEQQQQDHDDLNLDSVYYDKSEDYDKQDLNLITKESNQNNENYTSQTNLDKNLNLESIKDGIWKTNLTENLDELNKSLDEINDRMDNEEEMLKSYCLVERDSLKKIMINRKNSDHEFNIMVEKILENPNSFDYIFEALNHNCKHRHNQEYLHLCLSADEEFDTNTSKSMNLSIRTSSAYKNYFTPSRSSTKTPTPHNERNSQLMSIAERMSHLGIDFEQFLSQVNKSTLNNCNYKQMLEEIETNIETEKFEEFNRKQNEKVIKQLEKKNLSQTQRLSQEEFEDIIKRLSNLAKEDIESATSSVLSVPDSKPTENFKKPTKASVQKKKTIKKKSKNNLDDIRELTESLLALEIDTTNKESSTKEWQEKMEVILEEDSYDISRAHSYSNVNYRTTRPRGASEEDFNEIMHKMDTVRFKNDSDKMSLEQDQLCQSRSIDKSSSNKSNKKRTLNSNSNDRHNNSKRQTISNVSDINTQSEKEGFCQSYEIFNKKKLNYSQINTESFNQELLNTGANIISKTLSYLSPDQVNNEDIPTTARQGYRNSVSVSEHDVQFDKTTNRYCVNLEYLTKNTENNKNYEQMYDQTRTKRKTTSFLNRQINRKNYSLRNNSIMGGSFRETPELKLVSTYDDQIKTLEDRIDELELELVMMSEQLESNEEEQNNKLAMIYDEVKLEVRQWVDKFNSEELKNKNLTMDIEALKDKFDKLNSKNESLKKKQNESKESLKIINKTVWEKDELIQQLNIQLSEQADHDNKSSLSMQDIEESPIQKLNRKLFNASFANTPSLGSNTPIYRKSKMDKMSSKELWKMSRQNSSMENKILNKHSMIDLKDLNMSVVQSANPNTVLEESLDQQEIIEELNSLRLNNLEFKRQVEELSEEVRLKILVNDNLNSNNENLKTELNNILISDARMKIELNNLQELVADHDKNTQEYELELFKKEIQIINLKDTISKNTKMKDQLKQNTHNNELLNNKLNEKYHEISKQNNKIVELSKKLNDSENKLNDNKEIIEKLSTEIKNITIEKQKFEVEKGSNTTRIDELKTEIDKLKQENNDLKKENNFQFQNNSLNQKEMDVIKLQVNATTENIQILQNSIEEKNKIISDLEIANDKQFNDMGELQKSNNQLRQKIEELFKEITSNQDKFCEQDQKINEQLDAQKKIEESKSYIESQIDELHTQIMEKHEHLLVKQKEIEELKQNYFKLEAENNKNISLTRLQLNLNKQIQANLLTAQNELGIKQQKVSYEQQQKQTMTQREIQKISDCKQRIIKSTSEQIDQAITIPKLKLSLKDTKKSSLNQIQSALEQILSKLERVIIRVQYNSDLFHISYDIDNKNFIPQQSATLLFDNDGSFIEGLQKVISELSYQYSESAVRKDINKADIYNKLKDQVERTLTKLNTQNQETASSYNFKKFKRKEEYSCFNLRIYRVSEEI